jgi:hypothetical protein
MILITSYCYIHIAGEHTAASQSTRQSLPRRARDCCGPAWSGARTRIMPEAERATFKPDGARRAAGVRRLRMWDCTARAHALGRSLLVALKAASDELKSGTRPTAKSTWPPSERSLRSHSIVSAWTEKCAGRGG